MEGRPTKSKEKQTNWMLTVTEGSGWGGRGKEKKREKWLRQIRNLICGATGEYKEQRAVCINYTQAVTEVGNEVNDMGKCHANESFDDNNLRESPKGLVAFFQKNMLPRIGVPSSISHPNIWL